MTSRSTIGSAVSGALVVGLLACGDPPPSPVKDYEDLTARSTRLAQEAIIVDTHIDVPYRLEGKIEGERRLRPRRRNSSCPTWSI